MRGWWLVAWLAATVSGAWGATIVTPVEAGGEFGLRVTSLKEARYRSTVRQQKDNSCGSAALATLLTAHYGQPVGEQEVFGEMFRRGDQAKIRTQGFSMLDMKRYLDTQGYRGEGIVTSADKLAAAAMPAIVLIRDNGYNHFVVLKGMRDGRVLLGDPARGTRAVSRARFETMWSNRLALVAREHRDKAGFNQETDWRTVPPAPLEEGLNRGAFDPVLMLKGAADF